MYTLKLINDFGGQSLFKWCRCSPKWRLNPSFGTLKKCPFRLNGGVPSIESNKYKGYVNTFPGPNFVSNERCPKGEVPPFVGFFFFIVSERLLKGIIFHERIHIFIHLEEDYS